MVFPSFDDINPLVMPAGNALPERIRAGIESCISSSLEEIELARGKLTEIYRNNEDYRTPLTGITYTPPLIDAYTIDYLPRNFLIPRIAIRDLSINRRTVDFDSTIRVLDLGSGTGAVAAGLFDLFTNPCLSDYKLHFLAADRNPEKLNRQDCILRETGYLTPGHIFQKITVDLTDTENLARVLSEHETWDLIFFANSLAEIDVEVYRNILGIIPSFLKENGSIIIAEPAQDRGEVIILNIADVIAGRGLTIYYPCSVASSCRYRQNPSYPKERKCWQSRQYPSIFVQPINIGSQSIISSMIPLRISTSILNKRGITILDPFIFRYRNVEWGIIRKDWRAANTFEICPFLITTVSTGDYKSGSIVGFQRGTPLEIKYYLEL
jgi:SAM-dependent methyltransferase